MFGQIAGAVVGGLFANSAAKKQAAAQDRATKMQMQPYLDAKPYITDMYKGGTDALNNALNAGYYSGPTYAGLNLDQMNTLTDQFKVGRSLMGAGSGFGSNYANLFNQATSGNTLGNAITDATNRSRPLIDAAMRGADRNLNEVQLQNLNLQAAGSGNTRNSRTGVAEAILRRNNAETYADTAARINEQLVNQSMNQANRDYSNALTANAGLQGTFSSGVSNALGAANAYQADLQNRYNDEKANYEGNRDFAFDMYGLYNSNILGRAPQGPGQITPNLVDPTAAAMSGAMSGWGFGGKYLNNLGDLFKQPTSYGTPAGAYSATQYYNPSGNWGVYNNAAGAL